MRNIKPLIFALILFALALTLRLVGVFTEQISNVIIIISLVVVAIALYKLVFTKLRK